VWLLSEVDRSRLSGPELVLMTTALARAQTWLAAITEDTLLEVDARAQARADAITDELVARGVRPERGAAHPDAGREEIALALRVSPRSAQGRLDRARQLRDQTRYPGLAGLLAAGLTSHGHAAALISAAGRAARRAVRHRGGPPPGAGQVAAVGALAGRHHRRADRRPAPRPGRCRA